MATYHDPDEAVLRYFELRETLSAPPGFDPFVQQGTKWAEACVEPGCSKPRKRYREYSRKLGRHLVRCTAGHEWPEVPIEVPKGSIQMGRRSAGFDARLAELTTLERWLARIPRSDRGVYLLFLDPLGGGHANAAARANELGLAGGGWTYHRARRAVDRARDVVRLFMRGAPARRTEAVYVGA